jgi:hypothetical protein
MIFKPMRAKEKKSKELERKTALTFMHIYVEKGKKKKVS